MKKSKKLTAVYALIMDLPLSIIITVIALLLANNLNGQAFGMNFVLAYVLTFFINMFIPAPIWGVNFASKFSKPDTFKFGLLINVIVALVFVVILDLVMTAVGVLVFGHGTVQQYLVAVLGGFIPCYVPTLIIALFWNGVADKLSRKITNEPVVDFNTSL